MSVAFIYVHTCIVILCKLYHNTQVTFLVALEVVSGRQNILSSTNEHMSVAFIYVHTCIVILCKLYHNTQVTFLVALEVVSGKVLSLHV